MTIRKVQEPPGHLHPNHLRQPLDRRSLTGRSRHPRRQRPGSRIAVAAEQVLIYLHDIAAANAYANAWIDAALIAIQLPATVPLTEQHIGPALMVRTNGHDEIRHGWDPTLLIRIGNFTWRVHDRAAYDTMRASWLHAREMAPIILRRR